MARTVLAFLLPIALCACLAVPALADLPLQQLLTAVQNEQVPKDTPFFPPVTFEQMKGLFKSDVHFNFFGKPNFQLARDVFGIPDENGFVTAWVLQLLVETADVFGGPVADAKIMQRAFNAYLKFQDRNGPDNVPAWVFWPQVNDGKSFVCRPPNLYKISELTGGIAEFLKLSLKALGMGDVYNQYGGAGLDVLSAIRGAFPLPADADDSAMALTLRAMLMNTKNFGPVAATFLPRVSDLFTLRDLLVKYAYRPFSNDTDSKQNYFSGKEGPYIPLHVNNVDASVCANMLYGLTLSVLHANDSAEWFDSELQQLFNDSVAFLNWVVLSGVADERPDLTFLYYPPKSDYTWFFSRTVHALSVAPSVFLSRYPCFAYVVDVAAPLLRKHATLTMIAESKNDSATGHVFWDDFLGLRDEDAKGNAAPTYEDRLFTTAVTANALLDLWTNQTNECVAVWRDDAPTVVRNAVAGAVSFLADQALGEAFKPMNAFFSGSGKSIPYTIPYCFPSTFSMYLNGTAIPPQSMHSTNWTVFMAQTTIMNGVHGVVDESVYSSLLSLPWGSVPVPAQAAPYGYNTTPFPFWNSNAVTYAVALRLLSKFQRLSECAS